MTTLPKENPEAIRKEAEASAKRQEFHYPSSDWTTTEVSEREHISGYEIGAEVYCLQLHTLRQENERLRKALAEMITAYKGLSLRQKIWFSVPVEKVQDYAALTAQPEADNQQKS